MRMPVAVFALLALAVPYAAQATALWADGTLVEDNGLTLRAPWAASITEACRAVYPEFSDIGKLDITAVHKHAARCPDVDRQLTSVDRNDMTGDLAARRSGLASFLAGLTSPGAAETAAERSGINAVFGRAPTTADFLREAALGDIYEIQAGQLAAQHGNEETKRLAGVLVADHQQTLTALRALAVSAKVALPGVLDGWHQGRLEALQKLRGPEFSALFRKARIVVHGDAVSLCRRYANNGENAALKSFAYKSLLNLQEHEVLAGNLFETGGPQPLTSSGP